MAPTPLAELMDGRTHLMPIDVEQYHDLVAAGVLPEGAPYELLDGVVVRKDRSHVGDDPMTVGHEHAMVIMRLTELGGRLKAAGAHIRAQLPVTLPPYDEPEPDGAIVVGKFEDYAERHPGADDILCVIEVADASLSRDRSVKARIYADSGIPQHIIVNLPDRAIEVYTEPLRGKGRYGRSETQVPGQRVSLPVRGREFVTVPVRSLLP